MTSSSHLQSPKEFVAFPIAGVAHLPLSTTCATSISLCSIPMLETPLDGWLASHHISNYVKLPYLLGDHMETIFPTFDQDWVGDAPSSPPSSSLLSKSFEVIF